VNSLEERESEGADGIQDNQDPEGRWEALAKARTATGQAATCLECSLKRERSNCSVSECCKRGGGESLEKEDQKSGTELGKERTVKKRIVGRKEVRESRRGKRGASPAETPPSRRSPESECDMELLCTSD